jgi:hypothetical protein
MAKKTAHTRSTAQRNKPRVQKSIELVRPTSVEKEAEVESGPEPEKSAVATTTAETSPGEHESTKVSAEPAAITAPKASASARLAARRQAAQKSQRAPVALITAEHYSYVRKDLIFIAILAIIMFSIIIALHFVPAIGG